MHYFIERIAAGIIAVFPWTFLLAWMGRPDSVKWAHGLWNRSHPLNFGGNPSEVYSHLLNWIIFQAGVFAVAVGSIPLPAGLGSPPNHPVQRVVPALLAMGIVWSGVLGFAVVLDARHGEGPVLPGGVLFHLPTLLVIAGAERWVSNRARPGFRWGLALVLPLAGIGAQAIFEPSQTGGMNVWGFVLLPLFAGAVVIACWAGYRWGIRPR